MTKKQRQEERKNISKTSIPYISIICVVKNDATGVDTTLKSICTQNCDRTMFEVIVVNGGDDEQTTNIIKKYSPDIYIYEQDKNIYDAMNKGIIHSRGYWIYFLNAGDVLVTSTVLKDVRAQQSSIIKKQCSIVCTPILESYKGSTVLKKTHSEKRMPFMMPAGHQGTMILRTIIKQYMFDASYSICGDLELFARLLRDGYGIYFFTFPLAKIEGIGISNKHWKYALIERRNIQKKYYGSFLFSFKMRCFIVCVYVRKILRLLISENIYMYVRKCLSKDETYYL